MRPIKKRKERNKEKGGEQREGKLKQKNRRDREKEERKKGRESGLLKRNIRDREKKRMKEKHTNYNKYNAIGKR